MALGFYFPPTAFTVAQYKEAIKKLTAAGAGHPKGRRYHACFGENEAAGVRCLGLEGSVRCLWRGARAGPAERRRSA